MALRALLSITIVTLAFGPAALAEPTGGASAPEPDPSGGAGLPEASSSGGVTTPRPDPPPARQGQVSEDPPQVTEGQGNSGGQAQGTLQGGTEDNGGVDVQVPVPEDGEPAAAQSGDSSDGGGLARTGFVVAIILGLGLLALSIGIGVRDAARDRERNPAR